MRLCLIITIVIGINSSKAQSLEPSPHLGALVQHTYFSLSYVEAYEQPEWTFHMICKDCFGTSERKNNFRKDPSVRTVSAVPSDYQGTGYDRGHLVPAGDMTLNALAMSESFYMSNMSPQVPSFNRGIWKKLETQIRNWSDDYDTIYVVTGPIIKYGYSSIGENEVAVPQFYYKVIYFKSIGKMAAFIMPNEGANSELSVFQVTVDEVEETTKIDFFCGLDDELEIKLESSLTNLMYD
jgi:endonuclease G